MTKLTKILLLVLAALLITIGIAATYNYYKNNSKAANESSQTVKSVDVEEIKLNDIEEKLTEAEDLNLEELETLEDELNQLDLSGI